MPASISIGCRRSIALDRANGGAAQGLTRFTVPAAKYLAVAMAYDDVIRVADLKMRASRFERVRHEERRRQGPDRLHHRIHASAHGGGLRHAAGGLGAWIENRPALFQRLDRLVNKGRRVRTGTIFWFLALYVLSALRSRSAAARCATPAKWRICDSWLRPPTATLAEELRSRRRGARQPPAGEGLFRHPCARPVEVRPRAVGAVPLLVAARRRRRLAAPAAPGRAARRERHRARRRAEDGGDAASQYSESSALEGQRSDAGNALHAEMPPAVLASLLFTATLFTRGIALADGPRRQSCKTLERQLVLRLSTAP